MSMQWQILYSKPSVQKMEDCEVSTLNFVDGAIYLCSQREAISTEQTSRTCVTEGSSAQSSVSGKRLEE